MDAMIAGVDEVGRGALFGPVVAGAVILTESVAEELRQQGVTDSKKLRPLQREHLYAVILRSAIDCRVGVGSVHEIDRINILQASLLAMYRAIARLSPQPTLCLVDGNQRISQLSIPQQCIIQGDQTSTHIAAASIIAKVWRDRLITRLANRFQGYDLATNKGYGTPKHRAALERMGPTSQHRLSFKTCAQAVLSYETSVDLV
ncbi:MAG: ribonuclease HII [Leptolyngbyaceae bacterium]|nr:ribonuclease HII [Leptolyngbyaceae bacterium]